MKLLASTLATVALGYASNDICPSNYVDGVATSGCYKQNVTWNAANNSADLVSCEMSNPACLEVECTGLRMKASLRYDLFQVNEKHATSFGAQLKDNTRDLIYNGKKLAQGGDCGFTIDEDNEKIILDWGYTDCEVEMPGTIDAADNLVFTMALSSPGNAPGIEDIEFYVDTTVTAECKYPTDITLDASFWVNQEDTDAGDSNVGLFTELFNCEFFNDPNYEKVISDTNIVNMGQTVYGKASALLKMPGLKYTLTGVVVSDASGKVNGPDGEPKSYNVIGPVESGVAKMSTDVDAKWVNQSTGTALTAPGSDIDFSYLSFGFEDLGHQNKQKLQCNIKVGKACVVNNSFRILYTSDSLDAHQDATGDLPNVYFDEINEASKKISGGKLEADSAHTTDFIEFSPCDPVKVILKASSGDAVLLEKMEIEVCDRQACGSEDSTDDCPGTCGVVSVLPAKSAVIDEPAEHASFWFDKLSNDYNHCHDTTSSAKDICGFTAYGQHFINGVSGGDRICHTEAHFELSLSLIGEQVASMKRDSPVCSAESQTFEPAN